MNYKNSKNKTTKNKNALWIYGKHSITAALENSNRFIYSILITQKNFDWLNNLIKELNLDLEKKIKVVDHKYLENTIGEEVVHQGCALLCDPLPYFDIYDISLKNEKSTILILDQVTDTRNIGAIIRSAVAFDVEAIIFPNTHSPKENAAMVKAAAGGIEKIKLVSISNLQNAINILKENGYWIIGLDIDTKTALHNIDSFNKTALVLGSEGQGMRALTKKSCDFLAKLPMNNNNMESLNISNATSIALYELYKNNQSKLKH